MPHYFFINLSNVISIMLQKGEKIWKMYFLYPNLLNYLFCTFFCCLLLLEHIWNMTVFLTQYFFLFIFTIT